MFKSSFKVKIIFPTVIVLVALVIVLNAFLWVSFSTLNGDLINEKLSTISLNLKRYMDNSMESTKIAAVSMAFHPEAIRAIKERDRDGITDLFIASQELYGVNHFLICDNEGRVLVRTDSLPNFGDSIFERPNVKDALEGKTTTFFESAFSARVVVLTGTPVYDADDSIVGVIFAGIRFDTQTVIDDLKELFGTEITVFSGNERIVTTISGDGIDLADITADLIIAKNVIENEREYMGNLEIFGKEYRAFFMPLANADEEAFAAIFLGIHTEEMSYASGKSVRNGIILGLSGLAASVALLFYIISSISKPIITLSRDMEEVANGNLDIEISVTSGDEIGQLSNSLRKVVFILHRLLVDINVTIYEQERGNTNYILDTEAFHGDFKILAKNILELADLGMKDQLTGLTNRRSFDNRLALEWGRAMREKQPLSILMLDVDKFKNYNDAYGHQQGDVALRSVSKAIKQTVKRSIDFSARWGGEEFVVLLPGTDSGGAVRVAGNIRKAIENEPIPCSAEGAEKITVSVGAATVIPVKSISVDNFISMADSALYKAKEAGRNRVAVYENDNNSFGKLNIL